MLSVGANLKFCRLYSMTSYSLLIDSLPPATYSNPFQTSPGFYVSAVLVSLLKKTLWEKETLLVTNNFSFSSVFSTRLENFLPFLSNLNCRLQTLSVWKSLKFVVWERVIQSSVTHYHTVMSFNNLQDGF